MEHCRTKEELVTLYTNEYPEEFRKEFLKLSLTKLGNLSNTNSVRLNLEQENNIRHIVEGEEFSKDNFIEGLNYLSFEQINYVGW
mgnify:CR=1 FL=1|tara:strand:- start:1988 stop:2242 length:255 start_codon:yes stop_codon:yes gene_type:complete